MTKDEATQVLGVMSAAYPKVVLTEENIKMYTRMMLDLPLAETRQAVLTLVATSEWLPTIAELRKAVASQRLGPHRSGMEAFGDVVEAVRRIGAYRMPPEFRDPLVGECVRLMGWRNLCLGDNEAADRARFCELYESLAARKQHEEASGIQLPSRPSGFRVNAKELRQLTDGIGKGLPQRAGRSGGLIVFDNGRGEP